MEQSIQAYVVVAPRALVDEFPVQLVEPAIRNEMLRQYALKLIVANALEGFEIAANMVWLGV
jgi:hypothetical protein